LRNVVGLGPMSGPIELMRLAIGAVDPNWPTVVGYGVLWFAVTTGLGLLLQSRYDRVFVDLM
jgi:hypothetical protein